ncbi:hypothetical protein GCM10025767_33180 [Thalassotalea piscium]|uniref:Uncharacterized protein n=1 Tax=Thalassotalea piscium TaxID=1230533 RepID=A0A7X0NKS6_9GAMM|nr:hypothetical protein [Thalassotalea piscium]
MDIIKKFINQSALKLSQYMKSLGTEEVIKDKILGDFPVNFGRATVLEKRKTINSNKRD